MALIQQLNVKNASLEAKLAEQLEINEDQATALGQWQKKNALGIAELKDHVKHIEDLNFMVEQLKGKIKTLENPTECFCCQSKMKFPDTDPDDWWENPITDAWHCPDCFDDRPNWVDDLNEEWHEACGFKEEGPIQTYNMSGGHEGWWNIKLIFKDNHEYELFIENKTGWDHKKGAKLWMRMGDYVLIEEEGDDHDHDYICNEDWDEKTSYEPENCSM